MVDNSHIFFLETALCANIRIYIELVYSSYKLSAEAIGSYYYYYYFHTHKKSSNIMSSGALA